MENNEDIFKKTATVLKNSIEEIGRNKERIILGLPATNSRTILKKPRRAMHKT